MAAWQFLFLLCPVSFLHPPWVWILRVPPIQELGTSDLRDWVKRCWENPASSPRERPAW